MNIPRKRIGQRLFAPVVIGGTGLFVLGLGIWLRRKGRADEPTVITYPPLDTPKAISDGVWIVDSGPVIAMGLKLPVRMTIIRLAGGDLLLHSPTRFTSQLACQIDALGTVRHLIAPSMAHWTFLADWQHVYPAASTWAVPGLRDRAQVRRSPVRIDHELGDAPPDAWASEIEQGIIAGGAGFAEAYFFHKPSGTLVLTDLVQNLEPAKLPPMTRIAARLSLATKAKTAAHVRAAITLGGTEARNALGRMIELEPERVIFAHGGWFEDRGTERLRHAFEWVI